MLAMVAWYQRNVAIAAQQEAEADRDRISAVISQTALALAPDGKTAAVGDRDGVVRLFDIRSHRVVGKFRPDAGPIGSLAYSPDGRTLAVAVGHEIRLWDLATARPLGDIRGHTDEILAVQFSPDDRSLISRSLDGTVRVWDLTTGSELELFRVSPPQHWAIVISTDSDIYLAKNWANNAIKLGYEPAAVYRRNKLFSVAVGNYTSHVAAEKELSAVMKKTRADAYIVAIGTWCPVPSIIEIGGVTVFSCGAGK
jgi:WD40 repeat protein